MASLHDSLKSLGPVSFSEVPQDGDDLKGYLEEHLSAGKFLVESIPQPIQPSTGRSRAVSSACSSAEISHSAARSETPTEHEALQKDWGKPIKLSEKDNPLGISVFKLSGKDGRGAWFARRSVHEGLSFKKWKKGLQEEFEHSLQFEGGPGSGKVRGLGAETRPESHQVDGVGTLDVWHVSAQFPGPSAPRDFVSMVMTSDTIFGKNAPNHFMVLSKPCEHEKCPPQSGMVRGQYESVEFIREIPQNRKAASTTNLELDHKTTEEPTSPGRARGKTIGFAESRGDVAKGESIDIQPDELDPNPVEWIMITRSDPGGSVPRFLVERGTPGGIVADASKFLDWACRRDSIPGINEPKADSEHASLAGGLVDEKAETRSTSSAPAPEMKTLSPEHISGSTAHTASETSLLATATTAATAVYQKLVGMTGDGTADEEPNVLDKRQTLSQKASLSSISSASSYASAESGLDISSSAHAVSEKSTSSGKSTLTSREKELLRLADRKADLAAKLKRDEGRAYKDVAAPTEKEKAWYLKQSEKHDRELAKAEDRYIKALRSIEDKKTKDEEKARASRESTARKEEERKRKLERKEKERREKEESKAVEARHRLEIDRFKDEVRTLTGERDELKDIIRALQGENTKLVTVIGKLDGGERLLKELRGEQSTVIGDA